jgi:hypothetical protein
MPTDQPRRAWKKDAPSSRKTQTRHAWNRDADAPVASATRWSRKSKLFSVAAGFIVMTGLLVWVILWLLSTQAPALLLVGAGYQQNLVVPHNVYGWQGLQDLTGWAESDRNAGLPVPLTQQPVELKRAEPWDESLAQFGGLRSRQETLILYIAAYAGVDGEGAYLLPQDADAGPDKKNRLRLTDIIDRLAQLPARKNKVLVLDTTGVTVDWPLGMLHNDFARAVKKLDQRIHEIPNLLVFCASDEDQRSWPMEDRRQTVFAHYFIEGMKGDAATTRGQARLSAQELFTYLKNKVGTWARDNREAAQTPFLLPTEDQQARADKIQLTHLPRAYPGEASKPAPPADDQAEAKKDQAEGKKDQAEGKKDQADAKKPEAAPKDGDWTNRAARIEAQWQECQKLHDQVPSPAVASPAHWARYRALTMRYEELVRAGDTASADQLMGPLGQLGQELRTPRFVSLTSIRNAIPMPAALGADAAQDVRAIFSRLWEVAADHDALHARWDELKPKPSEDAAALTRLRLKLGDELLPRVANNPTPETLRRARLLLEEVYGPEPRPAEAHYLVMLKDLPEKPPPVESLKLAIDVRQLAEQAALATGSDARGKHPYSEQVFPWIEEKVAQADQRRRWGEDLLFASDAGSWDKSRAFLTEAQGFYREALRDGDIVRGALALRDELLAALPPLSHWAANQRSEDPRAASRLAEIKSLWEELHALAEDMEKPDPRKVRSAPSSAPPLRAAAERVKSQWEILKDEFQRQCAGLGQASRFGSDWRKIEDALVVDWIDPAQRRILLDTSHRIAAEIQAKAQERRDEAPKGHEDAGKEAGYRQRDMAVAVLGKRWIRERTGADDIQHPIADWQDVLNREGDQVGKCWDGMPAKIKELTASGMRPEATWEAALTDMTGAGRLARQVDGRLAAQVGGGDPVEEARRLRLHRLLVWLAQRTFEDHWFGERPDALPYYAQAGDRYLKDAIEILGPEAAPAPGLPLRRCTELKPTQDRLARPVDLALSGPPRLVVTSEKRLSVQYGVQAPEALPKGYPVVWLALAPPTPAGKGLRLAEPQRFDGRLAEDLVSARTAAIDCGLLVERPGRIRRQKAALDVNAFFRGQPLTQHTNVDLYFDPDIMGAHFPRPRAKGVAVRADATVGDQFDPSRNTLSFLLDCSGSMWTGILDPNKEPPADFYNTPEAKKPPPPSTRMYKAVSALEQVLRGVDPGVQVSVHTFIQAKRTEDGGRPDIQNVWGPAPWDPKKLPDLVRDLRNIKPYGETPLVRSLHEVKKKDFAQNLGGFRTMVVLTDGADSEFRKDRDLQEAHGVPNIPAFLQRDFHGFDIQLNIVLIDLVPEEKAQAESDYRVIEEKLSPKGKLYDVKVENDITGLVLALRDAVNQELRFTVTTRGGARLEPREGKLIERADRVPQWFTIDGSDGSYRVDVAKEKYKQLVQLEPGDFLLLNLKRGGVFERALYAEEPHPYKKIETQGDWLLGVLQSEFQPDRTLEMMLTLENQRDRAPQGDRLQQVWPEAVWFEVSGAGVEHPDFRYENLEGYPAPAWSLRAPAWPRKSEVPVAPKVSAWWLGDRAVKPFATLQRSPGIALEEDFAAARSATLDKEGYQNLSVRLEPQVVDGVEKSCLVVRLDYPPGKPVWVELSGSLNSQGRGSRTFSEHRFYTEANRYTGVFWDVGRADLDGSFALNVMSVPEMKAAAQAQGGHAEIALPSPSESTIGVRPRPVIAMPGRDERR